MSLINAPNGFAPEGAQRCRALTSGLWGQAADRKERLSEKVGALKAARAGKVNRRGGPRCRRSADNPLFMQTKSPMATSGWNFLLPPGLPGAMQVAHLII